MVKKHTITLAVAITAIVMASLHTENTISYFSDHSSTSNELSVGTCKSEIIEDFQPPSEIKTGDTTFTKTVQIKNTGTIPSYVRVFCDYSTYDMKKYCSVNTGTEWVPASDLPLHLPEGWTYITNDDPTLGNYYYYTKELNPDESTVPLFTEIKMSIPEEDESLITPFDIIVYAESIQIRDKHGKLFESNTPWKDAWTEFLETGDE